MGFNDGDIAIVFSDAVAKVFDKFFQGFELFSCGFIVVKIAD